MAVAVASFGESAFGFHLVKPVTHRGREVFPADSTTGRPDFLEYFTGIVGVLIGLGAAPIDHRDRGSGPAFGLTQPRPQLLPGMVPVPPGHRDHLVQDDGLLLLRSRCISRSVLLRHLIPGLQ